MMNDLSDVIETRTANSSDIPLWLQKPELAIKTIEAGLELGPDLFRAEFILENPHISSYSEFVKVITCMDYWGVDEWPDEVYEFIISHISEVKQWRDASGFSMVI